ncbi:unnamed protein product [Adineta steineri]|uniref:Fork-head domain-containing protein n=1 Tax=Adineta steineri TaxID=433720 RepID=A0A814PR70_9BILA|nr:unnamed protein product [Adineta steineri]
MRNEEDECDSSCVYTVASQSDVTSFLYAQEAKITGLSSTLSDNDDYDDESSIDGSFSARFPEHHLKLKKSYLSHSCFASISTSTLNKTNLVDDLTELKWLNSFKLKEFKDNKTNNQEIKETTTTYQLISNTEDHISKLSNELKIYPTNKDSISYGVCIFLALYSKRNDKQTPWSLTLKQIYEYIQIHNKHTVNKRGWKNLLKQTLNIIPCFIKTKLDSNKSRSIWTIDSYYRPLLTKAYLTNLSLPVNKITSTNENDEKEISLNVIDSSKSMVNNFPPKATVKTKALPRLYERLCEEKSDKADEDETESMNTIKHQQHLISGKKRSRSVSSADYWRVVKDNNKNRLSSSSPWSTKLSKRHRISNRLQCNTELKTSTSNKESTIITPCPSIDHMYLEKPTNKTNNLSIDEDDECDSSSFIHPNCKSATGIQNRIRNNSIHRRKSSLPRKRLSLILPTRRANTRISRKIIEQDLQLLRQANHNNQQSTNNKLIIIDTLTSTDDILDLSLTR